MYIYSTTIALVPINIIVVTRKKVTMNSEKMKSIEKTVSAIYGAKRLAFQICRIVFICRRRRSEGLLPFSSAHPPYIIALGVRHRCGPSDRTTSWTTRVRTVCTTLPQKSTPIGKAALIYIYVYVYIYIYTYICIMYIYMYAHIYT